MNKLAIFDLDGPLVSLKPVHFYALNKALEQHGYPAISEQDHLLRFDGLPTSNKLHLLGIAGVEHVSIAESKQEETFKLIPEHVKYDFELEALFTDLSLSGVSIAVVSNAKRETVIECLHWLGVHELVDVVVTPELSDPKPSPDMHLEAMHLTEACPKTTIIFEDSPHGLLAAHLSGARVVQVRDKLTKKIVMEAMDEEPEPYRYSWPELNVLIPAAGEGKRFKDAGYEDPKPFIYVNGDYMIDHVQKNLAIESGTLLLFRHKYYQADNVEFGMPICFSKKTEGTAQTCLYVKDHIDNDSPLLIANCDQILEWNHLAFYYLCEHTSLDGVIVVFDCPEKSKKWSYCEVENGLVKCVAEKEPISEIANTGIYFWKRGSDYVKYAEQMIAKDIRVNNEFYLAPVFNEAIADGKKIGVFHVDKFHSLGTPEDLECYLKLDAK